MKRKVGDRLRGYQEGRKRKENRRYCGVELLESRLVLSVTLHAAPVIDQVVVAPIAGTDDALASLGPALLPSPVATQDGLLQVDIREDTPADQRFHLQSISHSPLFRVDPSIEYRVVASPSPDLREESLGSLHYESYDVDLQQIKPLHVTKHASAADTVLVAELKPGDTSLLIADASGWSNEPWQPAISRSLAWYGYADSTGRVHDDYTYTRLVASDAENGLWSPGGIIFDGSADAFRVTLNTPWDGPQLAAGAAVRNATAGYEFGEPLSEIKLDGLEFPNRRGDQRWLELAASITGEWQAGTRDDAVFRPGTEYVRFISAAPGEWTNLHFGLAADFADRPTTLLPRALDQSFSLDLDVVGKGTWPARQQPLVGDYNRDGLVDAADYTVWSDSSGALDITPFSGADGSGDGAIDYQDYLAWHANFGATQSFELVAAYATYGTTHIASGESAGYIQYESPPWFVGTDVVNYTIREINSGETFDAWLTIDVLGGSHEQDATVVAILAAQAQANADEEAPHTSDAIMYTATDITLRGNGAHAPGIRPRFRLTSDTLVFSMVSGTTHGALRLNFDGTYEYTPEPGFTGVDSFVYEASDGAHATTGAVTIHVLTSEEELEEARIGQVAIAFEIFEHFKDRFPLPDDTQYFDAGGQPLLSWRVHLLPYVGHQGLFDQFHLDEPWNSSHNLPLLDQMPDVFRSADDSPNSTTTRLQTFYGPGAPFGNRPTGTDQTGPSLSEFRDGLRNTIVLAQSGADMAVPWTKPADLAFNPDDPFAALGQLSDELAVVMADGSPLRLSSTIGAATLAALVTIDGDELVDARSLARAHAESKLDPGDFAEYGSGEAGDSSLRDIALAMIWFHNIFDYLPPDVKAPDSTPEQDSRTLSWRVRLLPYLGHVDLYNQFHLDEPWDGPHNLALLSHMPDVFRSEGDTADSTTTRIVRPDNYLVDTLYNLPGASAGLKFSSITDNRHHTVMLLEAGADQAVPWTEPNDPTFDLGDPLATLGTLTEPEFRVAFVDASIGVLPSDISAELFSALVTRNGEELIEKTGLVDTRWRRDTTEKPATERLREIKSLAIAMLDFQDDRLRFPANIVNGGPSLLSWRVAVLPYLGHSELFAQFRRDEPWDSPHNLSLLRYMPDEFRAIGDDPDSMTTRVMYFTGPGAPFPSLSEPQLGPRHQDITDAISYTLAFIEAGPERAEPWTKPVDLTFDPSGPFTNLGELGGMFFSATFAGSAHIFSTSLSAARMNALITHDSGDNSPLASLASAEAAANLAVDVVFAELHMTMSTAESSASHAVEPTNNLGTDDNLLLITTDGDTQRPKKKQAWELSRDKKERDKSESLEWTEQRRSVFEQSWQV